MSLSDFDKAHVGDIIHGHGTWFTARLIRCLDELLSHADSANRARLLAAFPDEAQAVLDWYKEDTP